VKTKLPPALRCSVQLRRAEGTVAVPDAYTSSEDHAKALEVSMRRTSLVAAMAAGVGIMTMLVSPLPASAQRHGGGGGGGGHGISAGGGGGVHSGGGGIRSGGGRSFSAAPSGRSYSGPRSRGYVYSGRGNRHVRHFRGGRVYGYAPFVGGYAYGGSCAYYYRRAVATGSSYWWDRYYDCVGD